MRKVTTCKHKHADTYTVKINGIKVGIVNKLSSKEWLLQTLDGNWIDTYKTLKEMREHLSSVSDQYLINNRIN